MLELVIRPFWPSDLLAVEAAVTEDPGQAAVFGASEGRQRLAAVIGVGTAIAAEAPSGGILAHLVHHAVGIVGIGGAVGGVLDDPDGGFELAVWITPRLRGQGIGQSAFRSWRQMLEANGATKLRATFPSNDETAASVARACGLRASASSTGTPRELIRLSALGGT